MKILQGDVWKRRGVSLLWGGESLSALVEPGSVFSMRQFLSMIGTWPADLPSNDGKTMVVAGLEGCLDLLEPNDAANWLKTDVLPAMLAFQDEYDSEGALIFWLPTGKNRVKMSRATESYSWMCAAPHSNEKLDLGRILWSGAEVDVCRIIDPTNSNQDSDGPGWVGLHNRRLS